MYWALIPQTLKIFLLLFQVQRKSVRFSRRPAGGFPNRTMVRANWSCPLSTPKPSTGQTSTWLWRCTTWAKRTRVPTSRSCPPLWLTTASTRASARRRQLALQFLLSKVSHTAPPTASPGYTARKHPVLVLVITSFTSNTYCKPTVSVIVGLCNCDY